MRLEGEKCSCLEAFGGGACGVGVFESASCCWSNANCWDINSFSFWASANSASNAGSWAGLAGILRYNKSCRKSRFATTLELNWKPTPLHKLKMKARRVSTTRVAPVWCWSWAEDFELEFDQDFVDQFFEPRKSNLLKSKILIYRKLGSAFLETTDSQWQLHYCQLQVT